MLGRVASGHPSNDVPPLQNTRFTYRSKPTALNLWMMLFEDAPLEYQVCGRPWDDIRPVARAGVPRAAPECTVPQHLSRVFVACERLRAVGDRWPLIWGPQEGRFPSRGARELARPALGGARRFWGKIPAGFDCIPGRLVDIVRCRPRRFRCSLSGELDAERLRVRRCEKPPGRNQHAPRPFRA